MLVQVSPMPRCSKWHRIRPRNPRRSHQTTQPGKHQVPTHKDTTTGITWKTHGKPVKSAGSVYQNPSVSTGAPPIPPCFVRVWWSTFSDDLTMPGDLVGFVPQDLRLWILSERKVSDRRGRQVPTAVVGWSEWPRCGQFSTFNMWDYVGQLGVHRSSSFQTGKQIDTSAAIS